MGADTLSRSPGTELPAVTGGRHSLPERLRAAGDRLAPARGPLRFVVFAAYVAALAVVVPAHEPWFDEAQAWLLARDSGFVELFAERLRYEGTPGLWHLLLMVPAQLGASYWALQVVGALCAAAGVGVLVWRSPFPLPFTAGIAASYIVAYQYAVVARSYTLAPLLLFALAASWRRGRVEVVTGWLTLLACVSLHGFLVAGCLAAVRGLATLRRWEDLDRGARWRHVACAVWLLGIAAATVAVLLPPPDLAGPTGWELDPLAILTEAPQRFDASLSAVPALSAAAAAVSAVWFARRRVLLLWALPTVALLVLFVVKYYSPWHDGWPFLVWIFALWVSLDDGAGARTRAGGDLGRLDGWLRLGVLTALAAVLVAQAGWTVRAYAFDLERPYSGAEALATYLATVPDDRVVWTTGFSAMAAVPYLDDMPYGNFAGGQLPGYWRWSAAVPLAWSDEAVAQHRPHVIVRAVKNPADRAWRPPAGYRRTAGFDGGTFLKTRVYEPDAYIVYERVD